MHYWSNVLLPCALPLLQHCLLLPVGGTKADTQQPQKRQGMPVLTAARDCAVAAKTTQPTLPCTLLT
jgi:hypothetical protein